TRRPTRAPVFPEVLMHAIAKLGASAFFLAAQASLHDAPAPAACVPTEQALRAVAQRRSTHSLRGRHGASELPPTLDVDSPAFRCLLSVQLADDRGVCVSRRTMEHSGVPGDHPAKR